jgi:hypothetical protein
LNMDVKVQWKVSPNVEKLVGAIVRCRELLVDVAKQKHSLTRVGVVSCDAYADAKVVELLRLSDRWTNVKPQVDEVDARTGEKRVPTSEHVAGFEQFQLHSNPVMGEETVRVVLVAAVGEDHDHTFMGNVELVKGMT